MAGILTAIGFNPALAATTLMAASKTQLADPTNTHNVWTGDELDVPVNKIAVNLLPYGWVSAFFAVSFAVFLYWG